jgi:hypothetical protein
VRYQHRRIPRTDNLRNILAARQLHEVIGRIGPEPCADSNRFRRRADKATADNPDRQRTVSVFSPRPQVPYFPLHRGDTDCIFWSDTGNVDSFIRGAWARTIRASRRKPQGGRLPPRR